MGNMSFPPSTTVSTGKKMISHPLAMVTINVAKRRYSHLVARPSLNCVMTLTAASCALFLRARMTHTNMEGNTPPPNDPKDSYDIFEGWAGKKFNPSEFWNRVLSGELSEKKDSPDGHQKNQKESKSSSFKAIAADVFNILKGTDNQGEAVMDLVAKARESSEKGDIEESQSISDITSLLKMLGEVAEKFVGHIDLTDLTPTALFYYLEHEDERKNPSWKRRVHRFCPGIDIDELDELNAFLHLSKLCYADSVDEIREGLANSLQPYELVYAQVQSKPGRPANFVAVKRNQPWWRTSLDVIIGVRGTKSAADAITDLICDAEEYRGGKAHSFIKTSGIYIAEKHKELLEKLRHHSGKSKVQVTLIGHSLGAGAASIAGIELDDVPEFDVRVIGFGCPALLSQDLAEKYNNITTVINDSDVVPRTSGAAVSNLLLDILDFDWSEYAKDDIRFALDELQSRQPLLFGSNISAKLLELTEPLVDSLVKQRLITDTKTRLKVELFPPGKCVHFYRDGVGISGSYVPNTFFGEIDVSRRMIDGYQQTFLELMRQHKGDHHFRFEGKDIA